MKRRNKILCLLKNTFWRFSISVHYLLQKHAGFNWDLTNILSIFQNFSQPKENHFLKSFLRFFHRPKFFDKTYRDFHVLTKFPFTTSETELDYSQQTFVGLQHFLKTSSRHVLFEDVFNTSSAKQFFVFQDALKTSCQ